MEREHHNHPSDDEEAARRLSAARSGDPEERDDLERVARAERSLAAMSPRERERYAKFETRCRVEIARQFGDRLNRSIVEHLMRLLPLDHRAIQAMSGIEIEVPKSDAQWGALAKELVEGDPLARLNLEHSDARLKAAIREEAISRLSPQKRVSMARNGTLEGWLQDQVTEALQRRAGLS